MHWLVLFRKDTGQVEGFVSNDSAMPGRVSLVNPDPTAFQIFEITDPKFTISRDHSLILDAQGNAVDSQPSPNPVQPTEVTVDWRAAWLKAATIPEQISVLAKRLGLEA